MPKTEIDYSNTLIYKIICKDTNIADVYVGHTTNFVQRKYAHKQNCINYKLKNYKCKLYKVIRANGGWDNWSMEIINFFNCKDHFEARQKEQEYFIMLGATLNSVEPMPKQKTVIPKNDNVKLYNDELLTCNTCNLLFKSNKLLEQHNKTNKHKKKLINNSNSVQEKQLMMKNTKKHQVYSCEKCAFECIRKPDWERHLVTAKHHKLMNVNDELIKKIPLHICSVCAKEYKSYVGLWKHKKKCKIVEVLDNTPNENIILPAPDNKDNTHIIELLIKENSEIKNIMLEVVRSNADLQKQLVDACKNSTINNNNNTINSHNNNKTFNLQVFLNEQCKDAMNIRDFVNSFDLQLSDLESVGDLGYVAGMTKIILDKLSSTDIYKRPMHCSDAKRETIYIKDEDKWEKEQRNNPKLRDAIKDISFRNMKLTNLWSNTYPESKNNESRLNDVYMKLVIQSTGGSGEISVSEDKIIKRIAKEIVIDK